ncbi:MAG: methyltransferase domain-containing protein [Lachnospiraceae bacterium]|nr:methyltransferase domain-containing protein [Lachnospiraceae bacterium]
MKLTATETESSLQEYWTKRSDTYSMQNLTEMNSWKRGMWRDLILAHSGRTDEKQELKVLDIGTGPGFFAINLALAGNDVTAVDITEEMLSHAKENARAYQAKVHFSKQIADQLTFEDNTFDLIINRNVVWNLERPEKALAEWGRVLKPGGRIVYFDSNWYLYMFDDELKKERDRDWDEWKEKFGVFRDGHPSDRDKEHQKRAEGLEILAKEKLPLSGVMRPEWDQKTLADLGMEIIEIKPRINDMIYDESEQLYYRSYSMFMVVARKPR